VNIAAQRDKHKTLDL